MVIPIHRRMIVLVMLVASTIASSADDPLATLRPTHPRIIVLDDRIREVRDLIKNNATAGEAFVQLKNRAEQMMNQPPVERVLEGPRLLGKSRGALEVITTTAGLYRLTGDARYAERARKEMLAVAAFSDWNPSHFLDVAEMTNACGIGYDWVFDSLSLQDRQTISTAIVDKGLRPAIRGYEKRKFWTTSNMNWSQVCAGGLTVGALAIADEKPELAGEIIRLTRGTIEKPMKQFAPDGGWEEGPGYWNYATSYNVYYLAAIQSALGTDFGLSEFSGFSDTGLYHIQLTGPTGKTFNFADAGDTLEHSPQIFWLAKKFDHPEWAAWERSVSAGHFGIFHLLWFDADGQWPKPDAFPLDQLFKRIDVGFFRSSWGDKNAWYIGFKGGDNNANHSHLDLGSFVMDALGQRWAMDMGPDNYNLPEYFGNRRFSYYRLCTAAHNTLTIDGQNQDARAKAAVVYFKTAPNASTAVIDLSAAYPGAKSVRRQIVLQDRKRILIQDQIKVDGAVPIEWNFHTAAKVEANGKEAILSQGGAQLRATLVSPGDAKFETENCDPPAGQKPNTGVTNLVVKYVGSGRISIVFRAMDDEAILVAPEFPK